MNSKKIDMMITEINKQNEYDYKIEEDKKRINKNILNYKNNINKKKSIKDEILKKRMKENHKKNLLKKVEKRNKVMNKYIVKNPLSFQYNNKPLIPIVKDNIYNYVNEYNFDRYKILYKNEENRLKINKSVNFKIDNYSINKKIYMDNIKNNFRKKNFESQKKTEQIYKNYRQSNIDLKNRMDLEKAQKYDNFINYLRKKEYDNEAYYNILNNKRILAKEKYDNYFKKRDELILQKIKDIKYGKIEDDYNNSYKKVNTINNTNRRININNILKKNKNKEIKKLYNENADKLTIDNK